MFELLLDFGEFGFAEEDAFEAEEGERVAPAIVVLEAVVGLLNGFFLALHLRVEEVLGGEAVEALGEGFDQNVEHVLGVEVVKDPDAYQDEACDKDLAPIFFHLN